MKDIASIIRLDCNEEIDIRYFTKNGSISDTTCDYSELLDYINGLEDRIDKAIQYVENDKYEYTSMGIANKPINKELLDILKGEENN